MTCFETTLHELATNAAKYGSLSVPEGHVHVHWTVEPERFRLIWEELGGPRVEQPSIKGFGTQMLERALAAELGGSVQINFSSGGLTCLVVAPHQ